MLDTFEILNTAGVVLWSRTYAPVSPSVVNSFITDVFIEEKTAVAGAKHGASAASNPPYRHDQHTVRWTFEKELGIIFVVSRLLKGQWPLRQLPIDLTERSRQAVYRSLLHLSWVDKLVDNIRTIFVKLYSNQLKKPNTTIVECIKLDEYFDQQLHELETVSGKQDAKDPRALEEETALKNESISPSAPRNAAVSAETTPIATPNTSRPGTPGGNHLLVAKAGPIAKMSRRARKGQNNSAPVSSGDEGPTRRGKGAKPAKRGRKWDADGMADEEDDVQLDYSATANAATSDSELERSAVLEEVDASTWGSQSKGKFVLKDLGDEVHDILASAEASRKAATKSDAPTGLVGTGLSAIGGLFRNVVGGKVLNKDDLDKAMKGMEEHLLKKNVAREAAVRLCEGVEKELIGVKTGSFESLFALSYTSLPFQF